MGRSKATRHDPQRDPIGSVPPGRAARLAAVLALALAVSACSSFFPERPVGRVSADQVEYPNINNAPDRPSELKTPAEQARMEQELQTLGTQHVRSAQQTIQKQNRRQ